MSAAAMMALGAFGSATGGFTALSLAMDRHWQDAYGRGSEPGPGRRRLLRLGGSLALLVSLLACMALWGGPKGWVAWAGILTVAALASSLTLTYAGRTVARLGWSAGAAAVLLLGAAVLARVL